MPHSLHSCPADNAFMKNLRPETMDILRRIEALSGRPVEFKPDSSMSIRATLRMARDGAAAHVLQYRPSSEPLDYWVAYQAGYALRMFELPPGHRFDFVGTGEGVEQVATMLTAGQMVAAADLPVLTQFTERTLQWAMMNLRSYAIGMRIDQWIANSYPALKDMQVRGIDAIQQENVRLLHHRVGNFFIPLPFLAPVAAYAMLADRLLSKTSYAVPYRAAGVLEGGKALLEASDSISSSPDHDCELVDAWAASIGMQGWYSWKPYQP